MHEIVEGKNTKPSQVYFDKLAMAICGAVQDISRESHSTRFCKVTQVDRFPWASSSAELQWNPPVSKVLATQHQDYLRDGESWMEVLTDVQDLLGDRQTASWRSERSNFIYEKVAALVPWDLERVQVSKVPRARLAPYDIGWTHRGCCLLHSDGEIGFE